MSVSLKKKPKLISTVHNVSPKNILNTIKPTTVEDPQGTNEVPEKK